MPKRTDWGRYFDELGSLADDHAAVGRELRPELAAIFIETVASRLSVRAGERILDAGCGTGVVSAELAKRGAWVAGLDLSRQMLLRVRLRTAAVVQGDVRHLPFPDQTFDRAVFYSVVGHLDRRELRRALEELWRIVRPGGTVLIGDVMDPKRAMIWSVQHQMGIRHGLLVRLNAWLMRRLGRATWWYPQKELERMIAGIGFVTRLVAQDRRIPHSQYRYDCLAVRPTSHRSASINDQTDAKPTPERIS